MVPAIEINGIPHLVGPTGTSPIDAPDVEILNHWLGITNSDMPGAGSGGNVSCAVRDDMTLGLSDSASDGDRTLCSVGEAEDLTFYNFDAELTAFRDEDPTAAGAFNMFRDLTFAPDVPFILVHRIGAEQTTGQSTPFVEDEGQDIDLYYVWTDNQVPGHGDEENMTVSQGLVPKNVVNISYTL